MHPAGDRWVRVCVVGATGNIGTSLVEALATDPGITEVVAVSRRRPSWEPPKVSWAKGDIATDDLRSHLRGVDALVHLAWKIQPSHDMRAMWATNIEGTTRLLAAAAEMGVGAVVYSSSFGAYSAGPKDRLVDESWPTNGIPTSHYSLQKAYVERILDGFAGDQPHTRLVRLRPALTFKSTAASEIRRLYLGPLARPLARRPDRIPVLPRIERLRFQAVHSRDVAEALRLAVTSDAHGAFNLAAGPVLGYDDLAEALRARQVPVPPILLRAGMSLGWHLRLSPADAGWLDLALQTPLLSSERARQELGWVPRYSSVDALRDLLNGLGKGDGMPTPPLHPDTPPEGTRPATASAGSDVRCPTCGAVDTLSDGLCLHCGTARADTETPARDTVEKASQDSFPASDPPAY